MQDRFLLHTNSKSLFVCVNKDKAHGGANLNTRVFVRCLIVLLMIKFHSIMRMAFLVSILFQQEQKNTVWREDFEASSSKITTCLFMFAKKNTRATSNSVTKIWLFRLQSLFVLWMSEGSIKHVNEESFSGGCTIIKIIFLQETYSTENIENIWKSECMGWQNLFLSWYKLFESCNDSFPSQICCCGGQHRSRWKRKMFTLSNNYFWYHLPIEQHLQPQ